MQREYIWKMKCKTKEEKTNKERRITNNQKDRETARKNESYPKHSCGRPVNKK